MKVVEQILSRMMSHNTLLCVGLDPDLSKISFEISKQKIPNEEKVYQFLVEVVDATAEHVCAYKAQKAFFDVLPGGHIVLKEIIGYIHKQWPGLAVIVDCKIGDIDNTMSVYIKNIFDNLQADGVVSNPYMGDDAIIPLVELSDKAIVVLVQTSNLNANIVQNVVLKNGLPFWRHILDLVVNRWNYNNNVIPVLASSSSENLSGLRHIIPNKMPILLAGVGAQGGSCDNLRNLLNKEQIGVIVNSSRSVLYADNFELSCRDAINYAAFNLKNKLNKVGGRNE